MKLYEIPEGKIIFRHDLIEQNTVIAGDEKFVLGSESEAKLLYEAATFFGPGRFLIPEGEEDARLALEDWLLHKQELEAYFREQAENRFYKPRLQDSMVRDFWELYRNYRRGLKTPPKSKRSPVHKVAYVPADDPEEGGPITFQRISREPMTPSRQPVA